MDRENIQSCLLCTYTFHCCHVILAGVVIIIHPLLLQRRKAVVITARIHPGESNSSWMMKGFLDYLIGTSADAKVGRVIILEELVKMFGSGIRVGDWE